MNVITSHCRLVQRESHKPCRPYLSGSYALDSKRNKCSLLVTTMGTKLDLSAKLSLTTTAISGFSPVHADGRLGACQGIRLHAGTFNVGFRREADIKHTGIVVDLWWDFFVAFPEHPECT